MSGGGKFRFPPPLGKTFFKIKGERKISFSARPKRRSELFDAANVFPVCATTVLLCFAAFIQAYFGFSPAVRAADKRRREKNYCNVFCIHVRLLGETGAFPAM